MKKIYLIALIISAFVLMPSAFAQCPPDVSGTWVFKGVKVVECCSNPNDNGTKIFSGSFVVTQTGNEISASWVNDDGFNNVLTGVVNGNSVYVKVVEDASSPLDGREDAVGIIINKNKGKRIMVYISGEDEEGTCKFHAKGTVRIVK